MITSEVKPSELEVGHIVQFIDFDLAAKGDLPLVYGVITDWYVDMTTTPRRETTHYLTILHILDENRERIHTVPHNQKIHILGEMTLSAISNHQRDRFKKYRARNPVDHNAFWR